MLPRRAPRSPRRPPDREQRLSCLGGGERATEDQRGQRVGDLAVGFQVGLYVLLHGERHVGVSNALAQRLPVDLGVAACGGVASRS
jgi:hypothetical protein